MVKAAGRDLESPSFKGSVKIQLEAHQDQAGRDGDEAKQFQQGNSLDQRDLPGIGQRQFASG